MLVTIIFHLLEYGVNTRPHCLPPPKNMVLILVTIVFQPLKIWYEYSSPSSSTLLEYGINTVILVTFVFLSP